MALVLKVRPSEAVELALLALALSYPIYAVARLKWWGIPLGALVFWLATSDAGLAAAALDPGREVTPLLFVGLMAGWGIGAFYSLIPMLFIFTWESCKPSGAEPKARIQVDELGQSIENIGSPGL